ncbi:FAD-dependent oxidoreductase [Edwardsiella anguillarum]|nr:FAD-dependent oxidoreductase [Edwardsiella anguillarum]
MDAARTARRLGADEAMIIYRRDMAHMPAHAFEAEEAMEEGVKINWLRTIRNIDSTTVTVEQMTIDDQGRPQPTGRFETLQADSLILALGQDVDTRVLTRIPGIVVRPDGIVEVDEHMMTGVPGCSPAATWCPPSAPSPSPPATARRPRATSTAGCVATPITRRPAGRRWSIPGCTCGSRPMPMPHASRRSPRTTRRIRRDHRRPKRRTGHL